MELRSTMLGALKISAWVENGVKEICISGIERSTTPHSSFLNFAYSIKRPSLFGADLFDSG
ncbi:hypothetical protein PanWU01x14_026880 [Parasponia andersonii]|uniref:Uncharacterized protein n=1 Tax=Parasponia andersonii TaxID=3476 RepID=A0A2P5DW60_PARAD|nr:hypothetical protein PanWU01x14_026880 [Parasponia andersonii]